MVFQEPKAAPGLRQGPRRSLIPPEGMARKPFARGRLSRKLLDDSRFIDPIREAELLLPQQQAASQLLIESRVTANMAAKSQKQSFLSALYDQLTAWLSFVKKKFRGSRRQRARLTSEGERALSQLRYLSLLCDASEARTPDEVLAAESAFGEAYYEIMGLSSNLIRMSQKEQDHHLKRYQRHMSAILRATD